MAPTAYCGEFEEMIMRAKKSVKRIFVTERAVSWADGAKRVQRCRNQRRLRLTTPASRDSENSWWLKDCFSRSYFFADGKR